MYYSITVKCLTSPLLHFTTSHEECKRWMTFLYAAIYMWIPFLSYVTGVGSRTEGWWFGGTVCSDPWKTFLILVLQSRTKQTLPQKVELPKSGGWRGGRGEVVRNPWLTRCIVRTSHHWLRAVSFIADICNYQVSQCVCVCIFMCVCVCVAIHVYDSVCLCVCTCVCLCEWVHACICVCVCVCMCVSIHVCP